jgi:AraC-like DNA-binding protein
MGVGHAGSRGGPRCVAVVVTGAYGVHVLTGVVVARGRGFAVTAVTCDGEHASWTKPETKSGHRLVLVSSGRFRRWVSGTAATVDPTVGYLGLPGEQESFAHPAGGDQCTSVDIAPDLWRLLAGDPARPERTAVYVDARLELAHRRMFAATVSGDLGYALAEELLELVASSIRRTVAGPTPARPPGTTRARARARDATLATAAREAIAADHPAAGGLFPLAELLGVSPYRLSRGFSRELGISLTHYRNRVRVSRALERLAAGERNLGVLAADLGFSDQAHLTRTVRTHVGRTPAALRRLLQPSSGNG